MAIIQVGKRYYAMLNGEKAIVTIKGSSPHKRGFWTCELAIFGGHLCSFAEFELAEEHIVLDEVPPDPSRKC